MPSEPDYLALMAIESFAIFPVDAKRLPVHVLRAAQVVSDHAGGHCGMGELVHHNEATQGWVVVVGGKNQRLAQRQVGHRNVVQGQLLARFVRLGVHIDAVFEAGAGPLVGQLQLVGSAHVPGLVVHPHECGLELVGHLQRLVGQGNDVTARGIHLPVQHQGHGIAGMGGIQVTVCCDDARQGGGLARRRDAQRIAHRQLARSECAAEATEAGIRTVDPLHGEHGFAVSRSIEVEGLQAPHQGGALVPGRMPGALGDVVALEGRQRNGGDARETERLGQGVEFGHDGIEHAFIVVHEVHLVDGEHHLLDPHQRD